MSPRRTTPAPASPTPAAPEPPDAPTALDHTDAGAATVPDGPWDGPAPAAPDGARTLALPPGYRGLRVWQRAMELATEVYALTGTMRDGDAPELAAGLRRTSAAVATHIAEGSTGHDGPEYAARLAVAIGAVAEVETLAALAVRLGHATESRVAATLAHCTELLRMLRALQRAVRRPADVVRAAPFEGARRTPPRRRTASSGGAAPAAAD